MGSHRGKDGSERRRDKLKALAERGQRYIRALAERIGVVEPADLRALAEAELRGLTADGRKLKVERLSDGTWRSEVVEGLSGPIVPSLYPDDLCYICEQTGADSIEHVVARSFFAGTVSGGDIPQLPAHSCCNGLYSGPEEYVRNSMVTFDDAHGAACEAARQAAQSALDIAGIKTGDAARHAKLKLRRQQEQLVRDGGLLKWDPERADEDRWNAVMFKIVRGLAYWNTGLLLPWPAEAAWEIEMPWNGAGLEEAPLRLQLGDGFEARAALKGEDGLAVAGDFRLTFYQGVHARIRFST